MKKLTAFGNVLARLTYNVRIPFKSMEKLGGLSQRVYRPWN